MENDRFINYQINLLEKNILSLIDSDYVYLDFPGYFNVGDIFIAMGAFEILKKSPYACLYKSSSILIDYSKIPSNAIIIMQGGGNFGDLIPLANAFRGEVVEKFSNNKIIFFPQTVFYKNENLIKRDAAIFSKHKNLTIIARDTPSYVLLREHFSHNKTMLLPDTAWGLFPILPIKNSVTKKVLYFKRKDAELGEELSDVISYADKADWDDVLNTKTFRFLLLGLKLISKLRRTLDNKFIKFNSLQNHYLLSILYPYIIKQSIRFFMQYDKVFTTRLHGAIFCSLLNIDFEILDTKYSKINNYFNTWMMHYEK